MSEKNIFGENIFEYNIYELAHWIYRCKNLYTSPQTEEESKKIQDFASKWSEHRALHKEFYESELYQSAIIGSNYKRPIIYARHGKKKVDISELVYPDRMAWVGTLPSATPEEFEEILKNNVIETIDEYLTIVEYCFNHSSDYKATIEHILKTFFKETYIEIDLISLPKDTDISKMTKDEMLDALRKQKRPSGYYLKKAVPKTTRKSFVEQFKEFEITKTTYFDWKNEATEEKDIDKKFFVSLGLMLGLPIAEFESLLNYNGFLVSGSMREFDKIVCEGVCCGYGITYIQELIKKANDKLIKRYGSNCKLIPLLKRHERKNAK